MLACSVSCKGVPVPGSNYSNCKACGHMLSHACMNYTSPKASVIISNCLVRQRRNRRLHLWVTLLESGIINLRMCRYAMILVITLFDMFATIDLHTRLILLVRTASLHIFLLHLFAFPAISTSLALALYL